MHVGVRRDPSYGSVSTPIYQTVTYQHPGSGLGPFDYSRTENPTRLSLSEGLKGLEGGQAAALFSSGMAAITALCHLFQSGDHFVLTEDVYGGTYRLMVDVFQRFGIDYTFVDTRDLDQVQGAMTPKTKMVFIETPSNPLLQITNIRDLAALCHQRKVRLAVDNTFMTPLLQRPLELGADITVYSATKYLSGHNDVLAGALVTKDVETGQKILELANTTGGVLAPFDSWLVMRGIKTLAVRLDRQEQNARVLARFLSEHPQVQKTFYPGLVDHPGHNLQKTQARGFGAMISFQLKDPDRVESFMDALKLVLPAVSLGGTESLVTHPFTETHREFPEPIRYRLGILPGLIRLSVGIENQDDLMDDLDQALNR